ncbi:MAG TPA: peptidoglycan DD-metalloendopeptidase family protein [Vitreimonas sp.]|uniref:murein hydrolase activator EnvC family protein n=1 Tax=Vitreimonas sp. TaxID=3069702 RepID=UPI002D2DC451|nr:peptidoglycan DD-metalloendopeptidase family protein [Vitreimonas sp.]HYD89711.1 peptidoglycan DD-metalloendopeptidase family protein [Vitreimonas sp.]
MARDARSVRALVACAAGALALLITSADAQTTRTATQAERDRRSETQRAERLRAEAAAARREVRELDARLVDSGRRRAEAEAAASAAEERLAQLQREIAASSASRAEAQDGFERALIGAAFASRRAEPRSVRAGIAARAMAPSFAARERASGQTLAEARRLELAITEEQRILADAHAAIDAERAELVSLAARRRAAQAQLANDAAAAERRARAFAAEARSLRDLAQRASATARRRTPSTGGASVIPASWLVPAEGSVVRGFGAQTGAGSPSQGVALRTRAGAQVISPAAGEVTYAGPFRSYGQVLILNFDGGYALVLTGLDTISARVGENVRAGQPVGEMAVSDTSAPELYVEVRRDGRAVDPGRWLNGRGLTAASSARAG